MKKESPFKESYWCDKENWRWVYRKYDYFEMKRYATRLDRSRWVTRWDIHMKGNHMLAKELHNDSKSNV